MRWSSVAWTILSCGLALAAPLAASHPELVDDGGLRCIAEGKTVRLSWNIQFFAPIRAWAIARDGVDIIKLAPEEMSYVDADVPDGEHVYTLFAIPLDPTNAGTLELSPVARCSVVVGDFGLRCKVDGRTVHLEWGPILIDVAFNYFVIRRNGIAIARVEPGQLEYKDTVPAPGLYRYTVHAEFEPGHGFLIGACTVLVPNGGLVCKVDPPRVLLDWSGAVLPAVVIRAFVVFRDGVRIAATQERSYVDQPGPGEHRYKVVAIWGAITPTELEAALDQAGDLRLGTAVALNSFVVGECTVFMPGDRVPPPEELTCVDLDAPPELASVLDDLLRAHDVLLVWQKPIEYDRVVITRNDEVIARIPGSQFYYVDRDVPPGVHVYGVIGVVGDRSSAPARCEVAIPRPPLPPPSNLRCVFVGVLEQDANNASVSGFVALSWTNGAAYEWVVVVRNGERIARLPGNASSYRDLSPPAGANKYAVFGVVRLRRSDAAECEVRVPPALVPPPRDLVCAVIHPVPIPGPIPVDPAEPLDPNRPVLLNLEADAADALSFAPPGVFLRWSNPIAYDRITVKRNGITIATLPGGAESYFDHLLNSLGGAIRYEVSGAVGERSSAPAVCEVVLEPRVPPPPEDFECEVLSVIVDPIPLDPQLQLGAQPAEILPRGIVRLSWLNPVRYAALVLSRGDAVIARLAGDAMFYRDSPGPGVHVYTLFGIGLNGVSSRKVSCEVEVPASPVPPVRGLTCIAVITDARGNAAFLEWENAAAYDKILIIRNDALLETIAGDRRSYIDGGLEPGVYKYQVIAAIGERRSRPAECAVVIDGPSPPDLLYFSSGLYRPSEIAGAAPVPVSGDGQVSCLASNARPLQGWSFGVCSDPAVLSPGEPSIEGTDTAALNEGKGPTFLALKVLEAGVTMAAVVDSMNPDETLPSAAGHTLLRLRYGAGPEGEPGGAYPVKYCNTLGEPPVAVLYVVQGFGHVPDTRAGLVRLPDVVPPGFLRGDANGDGTVNMSDAVFTLWYLFMGGETPSCLEAADTNGTETVDIADGVYELQWEFGGGPQPPRPFPDCGPAELSLGCERPTCP
jgi:hypothetical protein